MTKKKSKVRDKALWLARDSSYHNQYVISMDKPSLGRVGLWNSDSGFVGGIKAYQSPIKLKPGEGPVKVRLVKA